MAVKDLAACSFRVPAVVLLVHASSRLASRLSKDASKVIISKSNQLLLNE